MEEIRGKAGEDCRAGRDFIHPLERTGSVAADVYAASGRGSSDDD
jgi:hypothetical protein